MTRQKHGGFFWAIQLVVPCILPAHALLAGQIRIWPRAVVTGETITLRDVAEARGFDPVEAHRLAELVVLGAPRRGGVLLVHAGDVRDALSEARINLGDVRIFGASRCKVSRPRAEKKKRKPRVLPSRKRPRPKAGTLPPKMGHGPVGPPTNSLEAALREFITARLADDDARLEIRFSPASRRALSVHGEGYRFTIHPPDRRRLGLLAFDVDIHAPGKPSRTVSVAAEVLLAKEVVVARRPINQGQVINGRDVKLEERRFSRFDGIGLTDLSAAIGLQSQRFLKAGDMLQPRSLRAEPLVHRGQYVKILIRGNGVEIRTTGKSQQAGALGDVIAVRRDGTRRQQDLIEAVVTGPGLVTYRGIQPLARR